MSDTDSGKGGRGAPAFRKARSCYDHLAGELGVLAFDALKARRLLAVKASEVQLSAKGRKFFRDLGIDLELLERKRRVLCRPCLDWSMRRHHLAGSLGAALLRRCLELEWARRVKDSRVISFSHAGEKALRERFSLGRSP